MANKKGILALLGIAGAFAWWKYRKMTPEEKEALKAKVDNAGEKLKETVAEVEETITETYEQVKGRVKKEMDNMNS